MKPYTLKLLAAVIVIMAPLFTFAQHLSADTGIIKYPDGTTRIFLDPNRNKLIPDKVFEIGVPLIVLLIIANLIAGIIRSRSEHRLKEKALDKQLSEETLIRLFAEDQRLGRFVYMKWFILLLSFSVAMMALYAYELAGIRSGYLGLGAISFCMSVGFFFYYLLIRKK